MNDLIECLHCHSEFKKKDMHICQHSKAQLCITCSKEIRKESRAELRNHKRQQIEERNANQKLLRKEKADALALIAPILRKIRKPRRESLMHEIDAKLDAMRDLRETNELVGL